MKLHHIVPLFAFLFLNCTLVLAAPPTQPVPPLSEIEKSLLKQINDITRTANITAKVPTQELPKEAANKTPFSVHVVNGLATISGVTQSEMEAVKIIAAVLTTPHIVRADFTHLLDKNNRPLSADVLLSGTILAILVNQTIFPSVNQVADLPITVSASSGMVELIGKVNDKDAVLLIATVLTTDGVKDVGLGGLTQINGTPLSNDIITSARVTAALYNAHLYGDLESVSKMPVTVYTNGGIVFLDGTVDTQPIMANSINTARRVPGVQRVISRMYVKFSPVSITI
jgi:hypothetical protein